MDTEIIQVIILSLIQGMTEFLPISSSAHLILPSAMLGWEDQGLAFDVMVHGGTLVAVCHYFRQQLQLCMIGGCRSLVGQHSEEGRLAWKIIISTLPACVFGLLLDEWIESNLRSVFVIGITTVVFSLLLAYADRLRGEKQLYQITYWQALFIGMMQAVALIPGTSRSGITLTAALFIGMQRQSATHYCFLLSVPLILVATAFKGMTLLEQTHATDWLILALAFSLSAVTAWLVIHFFLTLIEKIGLMPFVIYRLLLGMAILMHSILLAT